MPPLLSSRDLVVFGLYLAGGETGRVSTGDLALKCWELDRETFSWTERPQYPDKDRVRQALRQASGLVAFTEPEAWTLTPGGLEWMHANLARIGADFAARAGAAHEARWRQILWGAVIAGVGVSLIAAYSLTRFWLVIGSPEGHWVYPYIQDASVRSVWVALIAVAIIGGGLALPDSIERRQWPVVLAWIAVALVVQWILRSVTPVSFERIFISDGSNSFYSVARGYPASSVLRDFDRLREYWPLHAHSNMPGKLMVVYALKLISRRPDTLAWLVVLLSDLAGGVLMYAFVRDLVGDRRVALYSLILFLIVPAKLYFFPLLNVVTPAVALLCVWLYVRWLRHHHVVYGVLFGIVVYGAVLYEPLVLAIGLLLLALAARGFRAGEVTWRALLQHAGVAMLGFGAVHLAMLASFHFDVFHAVRQVGASAIGFNATNDRPYWLWVRQNLFDFFFGIGVCQAIVLPVALVASASVAPLPAACGGAFGRARSERFVRPIAAVGLGLVATLLVTDLLGVNRGEVIRLWIFLACLFQIPVAYACARLQSRAAFMLVVAATLLQDALGTAMVGFVIP